MNQLKIAIVGDASDFSRAISGAERSASGFGSTLGKLAKGAAFAAGAAGLGGLIVGLRIGIDEFTESTKVAAQTNAVIKSTGGAANVTAKQVDELATRIMNYSGMDDEAVKSGENMLLTFTNIRNEVGKGNDIFTQATTILADMSTALGTDMNTSAIRLGKALNDPIKGVGALSRVGVTFTQGQKDMIKTMVESGDTMGAQKLILAELNKEFGGSAKAAGETLPGKLNILKENFSNLAGELVEKLVPYLNRFTDWAIKNMPQIEAAFKTGFEVVKQAINAVLPPIRAFIRIIEGVVQVVRGLLSGDFGKVWEGLQNIVGGVFDNIKAKVQEFLTILQQMGALVLQAATAIGSAILSGITAGLGDIAAFFTTNVVNPITSAITGLATSIVEAATGVGSAIVSAFTTGLGDLAAWVDSTIITPISTALSSSATAAWDSAKSLGSHIASVIASGITAGVTFVTNAVIELGTAIGNLVSRGWDAVVSLGKSLTGKIASGISAAVGEVTSAVVDFGSAIGGLATRSWNAVVDLGSTLTGKIASGLASAWNLIRDEVLAFGPKFADLATRAWDAVTGLGKTLGRKIWEGLKSILNSIKIPGFDLPLHIPEVRVPDWVPFIGGTTVIPGFDIDIPFPGIDPIPELAMGGIATRRTLAVIGEAGPEAVVPLPPGWRSNGPTGGVTVNFHGPVYGDKQKVADELASAVDEALRRRRSLGYG